MKRVLTTAAVVTLCASAAFAATIKNTKHDLSSGSSAAIKSQSQQGQICVFCHTPHNAVKNIPLWNRNNPTGTYQLYTSSATLSTATKNAKLDANSVSMFCLSCHDGTVSNIGDRVVRPAPVTDMTGTWTNGGLTADGGANKSLTNDHPIGFDYVAAYNADTTKLYDKASVNTTITGSASKTVFFKSTAVVSGDSMECATCHVVHDNTNAPFLRMSNTGSALCLACHKK